MKKQSKKPSWRTGAGTGPNRPGGIKIGTMKGMFKHVSRHFDKPLSFTDLERAWLRKNGRAIAQYNGHVSEHGVFADGLVSTRDRKQRPSE
jgi:hypothetical protein